MIHDEYYTPGDSIRTLIAMLEQAGDGERVRKYRNRILKALRPLLDYRNLATTPESPRVAIEIVPATEQVMVFFDSRCVFMFVGKDFDRFVATLRITGPFAIPGRDDEIHIRYGERHCVKRNHDHTTIVRRPE
jgi:hypothetical protein